MKKTLTVNLGGTVYHIDDDAYRLLDDYLANLKHFFRKQEGAEEIVNDIEIRIAELFAEKVSAGKQVITIADVEEIIARVGKPEDFGVSDDESEPHKKEQTASSGQGYTRTTTARRLFRDPDNKLLGGVASGLAAYFDWDITLVRILLPDDYPLYYRMDYHSRSTYGSRETEYAWRSGNHRKYRQNGDGRI